MDKFKYTRFVMERVDKLRGNVQWAEIAFALNMSPSSLSRFRSGASSINAFQLNLIADYFKVPVTMFTSGISIKEEDPQPLSIPYKVLHNLARLIAQDAHRGQFDKGGSPYINHPLAVSKMVKGEDEKIVALLHDVLEDSDLTADDLVEYGFPVEIVKAVKVLTKKQGVSYDTYLAEVKKNKVARRVKIADITHNMDISRIAKPTRKDLQRVEKYKKALAFLEG